MDNKHLRVLVLGPPGRNQKLVQALSEKNIQFLITQDHLGLSKSNLASFTHLLSSGYHRRIPSNVLNLFPPLTRLNIHASYLPYGKGIGTILFALLYPCPIGSTIHILEDYIDTGDIVIQEKFHIPDHIHTQRQLYSYWVDHALSLFLDNIDALLIGSIPSFKQSKPIIGPYMSRDQSEFALPTLRNGWDTTLKDIKTVSLALSLRLAYQSLDF